MNVSARVAFRVSKTNKMKNKDFIDAAFERFEGVCSLPDIRAAFAKLDRVSSGVLDRQRFALALRGLRPSLELPPPLLYTAMEYFDTEDGGDGIKASKAGGSRRSDGGGGGKIDYRCVRRVEVTWGRQRLSYGECRALSCSRYHTHTPGAFDRK